jgi:deoxyribodipyrimidine photo-lyase
MQMQSGTTGINTLRIYSPAKQALDQDPQGHYIRQWIPEFGSAAYPKPIVDERSALACAKEQLYGLRQTSEAHREAGAIQHKHGSRKSGLSSTSTRTKRVRGPDTRQGSLF